MPRTVLSLIVAVGATIVGLPILWFGGALAVQSLEVSGDSVSAAAIGPALLALLGAAVLAVAGFSIRWSPVGALVVGGLHLVASATALAFPPYDDTAPPFLWQLVFGLDRVAPLLSSGLAVMLAYGVSALIGMALLVGGLTSLRPARPTTLWRVLAVAGGIVAIVTTVWALTSGLRVYIGFLVAASPNPAAISPLVVQLALAVLVFGIALVPLRGSTTGAWIAGVVITGAGLLLIAPLPEILAALPADVAFLVATIGPAGLLGAVGLTMLGIAAGSRRRRTADTGTAGVG
jgi:hypothetical protein